MKPTPPQVPGLPLIGNMRDFMGDRSVFFQRSFEKYGPIFSLQIGPKKMAVIAGAEA
ncbi:MAG: cytochrome P450, partial [Anaerolineae bacterium]|nr:cytochrome P450 [Anaerolineae bacterium]